MRLASLVPADDSPDRSSAQKLRLLEASIGVFAKGFGQASVAAIVKAAGTSRRTFYEHFEDLTDALVQLYDTSADVLFATIAEASRDTKDVRQRLELGLTAYVQMIASNADVARILYGEIRAAGPDHALRHHGVVARFAKLIEGWAHLAKEAKLIRKVPDEFTIFAAVYGIEGTAMRHVYMGREKRLAELGPRLVDFVFSAFQ